jgi:hypothetical protein
LLAWSLREVLLSDVLKWVGFVVGVPLAVATAGSLMRALIVPRGLSSRLGTVLGDWTRKAFLSVANRFESYETKDRILALHAPLFLILQLVTWLSLFFLAYALVLWPLADIGFLDALRESGSSMLTLGFVATPAVGATVVHFVAAVTGLVVVALQIAYLPALYGAFNRRETLVTTLQSRAGAPAWGPEILARHQMVGLLSNMPAFYAEWERWAADVAESHTNYVPLLYFRSPHPLRSWLVGLLAVMDSAAMYNALSPSAAPVEARLCLRMGFTCLRDIAQTLGIPYDPDPLPNEPIALTFDEFKGGIARLEEMSFPMERSPEDAWLHFVGWRVNYESIAYRLADLIVAPPGPWSGTRTHLPDMMIVPQRPANRSPEDPERDIPGVGNSRWRA